jgi:hypothetical protein
MRGLPEAETRPTTRIRRWDAVVLGTALPGLVAAARLGMHGARVLVLEEAAATRRPDLLREPFWMGGIERDGVLGACLRSLRVPLIDQRRIEPDPVALQIVLPHARLDVGDPLLTVDEWVAWGLAGPEEASAIASALAESGDAERDAMLHAGVVHAPRRIGRRLGPTAAEPPPEARPRRARGRPPELDSAPPRVAALLSAQARALSNLGATQPSPEAGAHLLGAPFGGSASVRGGGSLRDVLRRRIESLYGEFRALPAEFRLVAAGGQPGVAPDAAGESGEVWVGRAFVLNAPRAALAAAVAQQPVPDALAAPPPARRRLCVHLRVARELVPEAMAPRVVIVGDESLPPEGTNLVTLRRYQAANAQAPVDLVAQALLAVDEPEPAAREAEVVARVAALLPFAADRLERVRGAAPAWDDDELLSDPEDGGWPAEAELRLPTRQPIYTLERGPVASLGFEGDLLLGWRGGDAIAADLA